MSTTEPTTADSASRRSGTRRLTSRRAPSSRRSGCRTPRQSTSSPRSRYPGLYRRWMPSQQLLAGKLPARDRELLILRSAWRCAPSYEWGQHVRPAKQAGLSAEEIDRIATGPDAPGWELFDRTPHRRRRAPRRRTHRRDMGDARASLRRAAVDRAADARRAVPHARLRAELTRRATRAGRPRLAGRPHAGMDPELPDEAAGTALAEPGSRGGVCSSSAPARGTPTTPTRRSATARRHARRPGNGRRGDRTRSPRSRWPKPSSPVAGAPRCSSPTSPAPEDCAAVVAGAEARLEALDGSC